MNRIQEIQQQIDALYNELHEEIKKTHADIKINGESQKVADITKVGGGLIYQPKIQRTKWVFPVVYVDIE